MSFFVLTYSHGSGESTIDRFDDADEAMAQFVAAERRHRETADGKGVVLLIADDEETLRATHSHYFAGVDELLAQFA